MQEAFQNGWKCYGCVYRIDGEKKKRHNYNESPNHSPTLLVSKSSGNMSLTHLSKSFGVSREYHENNFHYLK